MAIGRKIGIIGCGNVGATIAYTLMMRTACSELVLIDVNTEKARGEAMDLNHCLPFLSPMQIYSGSYSVPANGRVHICSIPERQDQGMFLIRYTSAEGAQVNHYLYGKAPYRMKDYRNWLKKTKIYNLK